MKLIPVLHFGYDTVDQRFSAPMLPWLVNQIQRLQRQEPLSVGIEEGFLQAYDPNFELQFSHQVSQVACFSQSDKDPHTFLYLLREDNVGTLACHVFRADKASDVTELYRQMKEQCHQSRYALTEFSRSGGSSGSGTAAQSPSATPSPAACSASKSINLTSLCVNISASLSTFFEVLYVGKIKVWDRQVPDSFIDDALTKIREYQTDKRRLSQIGRMLSADNLQHLNGGGGGRGGVCHRLGSTNVLAEYDVSNGCAGGLKPVPSPAPLVRSQSSFVGMKSPRTPRTVSTAVLKSNSLAATDYSAGAGNDEYERIDAVPEFVEEHNRTMVLQVDRTDLRLISPDRKIILLHKHHRDVTTCLQGQQSNEYFGFVSRDPTFVYTGYIFKCESDAVASDAVAALTQAFRNLESKHRPAVSCDRCPMVWYHRLCQDVEHLSDSRTNSTILRRLEELNTSEQKAIFAKLRGIDTMSSVSEKNVVLMMLIRSHCEFQQSRHTHDGSDSGVDFITQHFGGSSRPNSAQSQHGTATNSGGGGSGGGGGGGGGSILSKARRSFELLMRKGSRDEYFSGAAWNQTNGNGISPDMDPTTKEQHADEPYGTSARSHVVPPAPPPPASAKSPIVDIFRKVGSTQNAKDDHDDDCALGDSSLSSSMERHHQVPYPVLSSASSSSSEGRSISAMAANAAGIEQRNAANHSHRRRGSWRKAIFRRIHNNNNSGNNNSAIIGIDSTTQSNGSGSQPEMRRKSAQELRELWRKAIFQAVLLVRMEKENDNLQAKQEESAVRRIKLAYDEMKVASDDEDDLSVSLMSRSNNCASGEAAHTTQHHHHHHHNHQNRDKNTNHSTGIESLSSMEQCLEMIRKGVPRGRRGEVWQYLVSHWEHNQRPHQLELSSRYANYNKPYEALLRHLTAHQHAILIDLGRTFPTHSYFSSPLGPGQLALFNLLKAYSLLDEEMGYCQGLSFVAGILLLHMEESNAFRLLKHLMFERELRKQYLPDMMGLQVKLYQLSRLLHDRLPHLYRHLDALEVAPTLYAAPWLLTMFASQFPLGFVARVFDMVFVEGPDVVFRIVLALMRIHESQLLQCDNFEDAMTYLKTNITQADAHTLDQIMNTLFDGNETISDSLAEYAIEYHVLQEELSAVGSQCELDQLKRQLADESDRCHVLRAQLDMALSNVQRLERSRTLQRSQLNKCEIRNRELEADLSTLVHYVNNGLMGSPQITATVPDDVRRIVQYHQQHDQSANLVPINQLSQLPITSDSSAVGSHRKLRKSLSLGRLYDHTSSAAKPITSRSKGFFSPSHNSILQHKQQWQNMRFATMQETAEDPDADDAEDHRMGHVSPSSSMDSGVDTPSSLTSISPKVSATSGHSAATTG